VTVPFTVAQFFAVFARYNSAVWPAQVILVVLALVAIALAVRSRAWSDRAVAGVLGLLWVWMGVVYHWTFFRAINPAAAIFGGLFVLEGTALLVSGGVRHDLRFRARRTVRGLVGALLLVFALGVYPLLGYAAGHRYPATPTFGLPCPTTIFTLGLLLWVERPMPKALFLVPLAWSALGASAALQLAVREDLGLFAAGALAGLLTFRPQTGAPEAVRATGARGTGRAPRAAES
jgi:Family of unknown function (DUF6064)